MNQDKQKQQRTKKAIVFICNGIVEGAYSTDPDLELIVVDYDKDVDDKGALDKLYDECINDPALQNHTPIIIHPGDKEW